jgi:lysophospholipase
MWKWEAEGQAKGVIAILHSAYEQHRWYAWLIEQLRSDGYHVVMGDLPGHGEQSKFSEVHNEDFVDYQAHTKKLFQVAQQYNLPLFIIGNGLGATVAISTLLKHKFEVTGIILNSPWFQLKKTPGKMSGALSSLGKLASNVKVTHDITLHDLTRNSALHEHMKFEEIPYNNTITVKWYQEIQNQMRHLRNPELKLENVPYLIMTGGQDAISDIAAAKTWLMTHSKSLQQFQYREWPNAYHSLVFEMEREEVYQYMIDFINNCIRSVGYVIENK